jgi:hypothetical protein
MTGEQSSSECRTVQQYCTAEQQYKSEVPVLVLVLKRSTVGRAAVQECSTSTVLWVEQRCNSAVVLKRSAVGRAGVEQRCKSALSAVLWVEQRCKSAVVLKPSAVGRAAVLKRNIVGRAALQECIKRSTVGRAALQECIKRSTVGRAALQEGSST